MAFGSLFQIGVVADSRVIAVADPGIVLSLTVAPGSIAGTLSETATFTMDLASSLGGTETFSVDVAKGGNASAGRHEDWNTAMQTVADLTTGVTFASTGTDTGNLVFDGTFVGPNYSWTVDAVDVGAVGASTLSGSISNASSATVGTPAEASVIIVDVQDPLNLFISYATDSTADHAEGIGSTISTTGSPTVTGGYMVCTGSSCFDYDETDNLTKDTTQGTFRMVVNWPATAKATELVGTMVGTTGSGSNNPYRTEFRVVGTAARLDIFFEEDDGTTYYNDAIASGLNLDDGSDHELEINWKNCDGVSGSAQVWGYVDGVLGTSRKTTGTCDRTNAATLYGLRLGMNVQRNLGNGMTGKIKNVRFFSTFQHDITVSNYTPDF